MFEKILTGKSGTLFLSSRGRITGLIRKKVDVAAKADTAFILGFRDEKRNPVILDDNAFEHCTVEDKEYGVVYTYTGNAYKLEVTLEGINIQRPVDKYQLRTNVLISDNNI